MSKTNKSNDTTKSTKNKNVEIDLDLNNKDNDLGKKSKITKKILIDTNDNKVIDSQDDKMIKIVQEQEQEQEQEKIKPKRGRKK